MLPKRLGDLPGYLDRQEKDQATPVYQKPSRKIHEVAYHRLRLVQYSWRDISQAPAAKTATRKDEGSTKADTRKQSFIRDVYIPKRVEIYVQTPLTRPCTDRALCKHALDADELCNHVRRN